MVERRIVITMRALRAAKVGDWATVAAETGLPPWDAALLAEPTKPAWAILDSWCRVLAVRDALLAAGAGG